MSSLRGTYKGAARDVCQWVWADVGVFIRNRVYRGIIMPALSSLAKGTIRISLGKDNASDDIDVIVAAF